MSKEIPNFPFFDIAKNYGTPCYIYDRKTIESRIDDLKDFDVVRFAQKALSNIGILSVVRQKKAVVDAVSAGEIVRAMRAGFKTGPGLSEIVYTADIFDDDAVELISKHQITVNVGSMDMLNQLAEFSPKSEVVLRINPGFGHGHSKKVNTGGNLSKHGIWHDLIPDCMALGKQLGLNIVGLHMHIGSGSDFEHLSTVCDAMVSAAKQFGSGLKVISAGGGLPIPYQKNGNRIDVAKYYQTWDAARKKIEAELNTKVELEVEPGRYLVAESGYLLSKICSVKNTGGTDFYVVDAGFNTLIRPAMYGAFHEISILSQDANPEGEREVVVAGPLCESCDVFTQEEGGFVTKRNLPEAKVGDLLLIHDAGAYGSVMSSNYNTRKLAPELLIEGEKISVIRKPQTFDQILELEQIP